MHWTDEWIGLPYELRGRGPAYDCLGLWLAVTAARSGRVIPDPACDQREALRGRVVARLRPLFSRVGEAVEGDLLLFRAGRRYLHVGYALGPRDMLHIETDIGHSRIEDRTTVRWRDRLEGVYRAA